MGHRLVLEARLLEMINGSFDMIHRICENFDEIRGNRDAVTNERDVSCLYIAFLKKLSNFK